MRAYKSHKQSDCWTAALTGHAGKAEACSGRAIGRRMRYLIASMDANAVSSAGTNVSLDRRAQ